MPCHDCSLLSIFDSIRVFDSIPSPSVSNHAWFSKGKDKNTTSSYTIWPHEYAYIQCCQDRVDLPVQALQHHLGKRINIINSHHNIS